MSNKAQAWAWQQPITNPTKLLLLLALADFADDAGKCWPAQATLAKLARCSVRQAARLLKELVDEHYVGRLKRGSRDGGRTSDWYTLPRETWVSDGVTGQNVRKPKKQPVSGHLESSNPSPLTGHVAPGLPDTAMSEEPLKEPPTVKKESLFLGEPSFGVSLERGKLALSGSLRDYWLGRFGGNERRLTLALEIAEGYVQPNSSRPLEAQVSSQLARQLADKEDRDERYEAARKSSAPPVPSGPTAAQLLGMTPGGRP